MANLYKHQTKLLEAEECLRKLIILKPKQSSVYLELANLLAKQDKKAESLKIYQQLIELDPKQPLWIYKYVDSIQHSEDILEKALVIYQQAIEQDKSQPPFVYLSLSKILCEKQQFWQAHEIAQQALKKYPQNSYLVMSLADINYHLGKIEDAIQIYQRAIELKANFQAYFKLGNIYQEQNKFKKAIAAYIKADNLSDQTNIGLYVKLGECYHKQQKIPSAISTYNKVVFLINDRYYTREIHSNLSYLYLQQGDTELAKKHYKLELADNCLINHKHKIIYCPIPKNACTLFKTMMVEHSSDRERYYNSQENIHHYASSRRDTAVALDSSDYLTNPNYFKFAILRNPFERLVSAYLDKIVKHEIPELFAQKFIKKVQQFLKKDYDLKKSISFQEFIQYLAKTEDYDLNEHWQTQSYFLGRELLEFDYFGQFEKLDQVVKDLENKFKFTITIDVTKNHNRDDHITKYINDITTKKYQEKYPQELRCFQLEYHSFPEPKSFYSPELIELVKIRFAQDIELYQHTFSQQIL